MMSNENAELAKRDDEEEYLKLTKHDIAVLNSASKHIETCNKARAKRKKKRKCNIRRSSRDKPKIDQFPTFLEWQSKSRIIT